ncbi:fluoride efflux transporter CrcB [Cohnella sp. CFH 77786]|uniref:fluoride efflux transporter CrcB n=1 Tax=Cohnella sp. CFH 77786 TaxID=2662265 RepID=UPI001C60B034|nr:fluoride efflux transporter CrcB [Cohnella sp. CFH 77786]MBW5448778.1 fluoride efflux transporter CrcB [Cohnella sp. CFH 77786]
MIFLIGVGGIAGAYARYYLGKRIDNAAASLFPWGTFVINATGSFLLGVLFTLHTRDLIPLWTWLLLGTGFCGAYTTFSTFGYEAVKLLERRRLGLAAAYALGSAAIGLLIAWLGMSLVR